MIYDKSSRKCSKKKSRVKEQDQPVIEVVIGMYDRYDKQAGRVKEGYGGGG